ncbi:MAG: heavy metal translocating P-type ATPase, partial [bacterium]
GGGDVRRAGGESGGDAPGACCASGTCQSGKKSSARTPDLKLHFCAAGLLSLFIGFAIHAATHGIMDALTGGFGGEGHEYPAPAVAFYSLSVAFSYWYVARKAWSSLLRMRPDMNLLMSVAVVGAAALGDWFEAASVAWLFAVALLLESWSVGRARRAVEKLMDLSPQTARYVCAPDGSVMELPVASVPFGATIIVRPGERIPLDGVVTKGATSVNESPITGESAPAAKEPGDKVFAGTINNEGAIEFRSTKKAEDTTLARIIRMVEEAQRRRAPSEQWVEKFARWYTPLMFLTAMVIAVVPPLFSGDWQRWLYEALVVLVIACPCALVISTPVSIVAGLASAARAGVLVKGGAFLEAPASVSVVAFDKTGTLTRGLPAVTDVIPLNNHTEAEIVARTAALESLSAHPFAQAITDYAKSGGGAIPQAESLVSFAGKGAEGLINGKPYWIGSHRLMHERGYETPEYCDRANALEAAGKSVVAVGTDSHVCGILGIADEIRPGAADAVRALKDAGIARVVMLTGDGERAAAAIADAAGVDEFRASLLPEDKVAAVEKLVADFGKVMMVGDGVNDAPALAASTVGIAMGAAGSDAAIETADVALMSDDLSKLPWLVRHSRRTLGTIKANIAFALAIKAAFMALALAGAATLWMAILADMGASLAVIANGLRLIRSR